MVHLSFCPVRKRMNYGKHSSRRFCCKLVVNRCLA
jgi:hypothetical protein